MIKWCIRPEQTLAVGKPEYKTIIETRLILNPYGFEVEVKIMSFSLPFSCLRNRMASVLLGPTMYHYNF
jgi:hypothetical protein